MSSDVTDLILRQSNESAAAGGIPGVLADGSFWHWQMKIDEATINYRRSLQSARKVLRFGALLLAGISTLGGVMVFGLLTVSSRTVSTFFTSPTLSLGLVGLGMLFGLFAWYRGRVEERVRTSLQGVGKTTKPELTTVPSLAAVERRCCALDEFNACQINRRNIERAECTGSAAVNGDRAGVIRQQRPLFDLYFENRRAGAGGDHPHPVAVALGEHREVA